MTNKKAKKQQKKSVEIPPPRKRPDEILPSRKRTNDIIRGIELMQIIDNINDENVRLVESWLEKFKPNLKQYLKDISTKKGEIDTDIHCRDLNYILDTLLERISKLKTLNGIKWDHDIQKDSNYLLNSEFRILNCPRNMYNSNNNYMHIKKHMHDLCEDIKYIIDEKTKLQKKNNLCNYVISRLLERRKRLLEVYHTNPKHQVFHSDSECTIDYIMDNFSGTECIKVPEPRRAKAQAHSRINDESEQGLGKSLATAPGLVSDTGPRTDKDAGPGLDPEAASEQEDDVDLSDAVVTDFGMNMPLQLPPVEEPKLDTTYAAASLCGVSLIGAMIYKFKPFGFGSRAPGMRNGMGGYPLPHAANGDYFMDNFEYLQTSIPNNEYHLGYGPAADH
ncbi:unnamed protein product [Plasmodium vivax]|uniref:(malaria parasite P. vivax) hypothetical protein n=1 Tax=Plasmodium vivax TaxID=5855 RepID=A0A8S4HMR6_PLAVI|nr:unnamed protein product [Plasmodium vivax]